MVAYRKIRETKHSYRIETLSPINVTELECMIGDIREEMAERGIPENDRQATLYMVKDGDWITLYWMESK